MKRKRIVLWIGCKSVQLLLSICVLLICSMFVPGIFSLHCFCVQTGSMEPSLPVGSLIYVRKADAEDYSEGDIITYLLNQEGTVVTHRISAVLEEAHTFITKGDANDTPDGKNVSVENVIGKVLYCIPCLGYFFIFLSSEMGKMIWIGLLMGLFVLSEQMRIILNGHQVTCLKRTSGNGQSAYLKKENVIETK